MIPPGVVEWGTTPKDFFEKKAAIICTTTGNLTNIRANAKFPIRRRHDPGQQAQGPPTGGGNFYIFKKSTPAEQQARCVHQVDDAAGARGAVEHGHRLRRGLAGRLGHAEMKKYAQDFPPALVARDQLPVSVAEFSTHDNQRVTKALNDGLQAALTGTKTPAQAMQDAQREATASCKDFKTRDRDDDAPARARVTPWLLLLPALVLLVAFTHWPAVSTLFDSFYSTPKRAGPASSSASRTTSAWSSDPVFWKAVRNNSGLAGATIPLSIALALVMALWVNSASPGRAFLRMAYFTPTVLPMIAVANIWLFFYTPQYGLLEQITRRSACPRTTGSATAHGARRGDVVAIWKEAGFFMIFYLAALQQIPPRCARRRRSKAPRAGSSSAACSGRC